MYCSALIAVSVAFVVPSLQAGDDSKTRAIIRIGQKAEAPQYGQKWALVVGVDKYPDPKRHLKNAVNDAKAVKDKLEKYGFRGDHVFYLTDEKATRQKILDVFEQTLRVPAKVKPDDCVIVFFAGHGDVGQDKQTYLLPVDANFGGASLSESSAIGLGDVRRRLLNECPAKHKLLVLDCCHAGGVFRLDGAEIKADEPAPTDGAFKAARVVQAITSTRGTQEARDGGPGNNSPFTTALITALETIPTTLNNRPGEYQFTTTTLFGTMLSILREDSSLAKDAKDQTPQCMWLDQERQGEFHFLPDPAAKFDTRIEDKEGLLQTMTPTTFGNWWAEEVPWFMPGLRYEILTDRPASRSVALPELDREQLRVAADAAAKRLGESKRAEVVLRVKHLKLLLGQSGSKAGVIEDVAKDLREAVDKDRDAADPLDVHYLAVLEHKLGRRVQAHGYYTLALKRYDARVTDAPKRFNPLRALCLADLGTFELMVLKDYPAAVRSFEAALRVYAADTPAPFKVYALCQGATACRRQGYDRPAATKIEEAERALSKADPLWESPLAVATLKQFAWADMEQWKFKSAREKFEAARGQLTKLMGKGSGRDEYQADALHIDHGLAMIERFQGHPDKALRLYRDLTPQIAKAINELDDRTVFNYTEVRRLLYARLVNSLQRQGDCSLFAPIPDYAEAADDYRRALLEIENLDPDAQNEYRVKLLYCRAIALACNSPARDPDRARHMFTRAEESVGEMNAIELQTEICRSIALSLLYNDALPTTIRAKSATRAAVVGVAFDSMLPSQSAKPPVAFSVQCELLRRNNRALDRDELERLMFGYRLVIEAGLPAATDPAMPAITPAAITPATNTPAATVPTEIAPAATAPAATAQVAGHAAGRNDLLRNIDRLLKLCRQACRRDSADPDPDLLAYLRPYYELAFRGKLAAAERRKDGGHPLVKELIEIAWEATQGTPYNKPSEPDPVLVLFCFDGQGCFLLDAAGFGNRCYVLKNLTPDDLRVRNVDVADKAPPLPLDLLSDLRELSKQLKPQAPGPQLVLRWGDPRYRLGYDDNKDGKDIKVGTESPDDQNKRAILYRKETARTFPFELNWAVKRNLCRRCKLERDFETYLPWKAPFGASAPAPAIPPPPAGGAP